jgi:ribose 5-phosphate isomerase B
MARRRLITERDVVLAARSRRASIDALGAAVTPSARDAARSLGIELRTEGAAGPSTPETAPAAPSLGAATPAAEGTLRVVLGADHGGVPLKDVVLGDLRSQGHVVTDVGAFGSEPVDYPDYAQRVARAVAAGSADVGIMIDGAGIGSCMVCNKVAGVRAAMCHDVTTAKNAREHNHANVLTLGGGLLGHRLAMEIVTAFLATPFGGERHARRVSMINQLDSAR